MEGAERYVLPRVIFIGSHKAFLGAYGSGNSASDFGS